MNRRQRVVQELAKRFGCVVERTKAGHLRLKHWTGWSVVTSASANDRHADRNLLADLRRQSRTGGEAGGRS